MYEADVVEFFVEGESAACGPPDRRIVPGSRHPGPVARATQSEGPEALLNHQRTAAVKNRITAAQVVTHEIGRRRGVIGVTQDNNG